jgi:hypothetical protein
MPKPSAVQDRYLYNFLRFGFSAKKRMMTMMILIGYAAKAGIPCHKY